MQKTFHLTERDINAVVEDTRAYLVGKKVADKDILKLELFIEEALLRYRDKFGRGQEAVVETSSLPTAKIVIKLKAECFNPIMEDEESILSSEYLRNLMEIEGSSTTYRYRNGYNEIVAMAHRKSRKWKTPGGAVTIAVVLAIVASFLTKNLPESTISLLVNDLASPILSRIMGVIVLVTSPLICISVISGICALDDIATLSSIGLKAIRRFVVITLLMITFCVLVNLFIFPGISASGQGAISIAGI